MTENKENNPRSGHSYMEDNKNGLKKYSFFSQEDPIAWNYYCEQQVQMWSASEIPYTKDKNDYDNLSPRSRLLFEEILGFFAPGDGLVSESIMRQLRSAKNSMECGFLFFQAANEVVHAETYGRFIKMFSRTPEEEDRIFSMVETVDCISKKANFIQKYTNSMTHVSLRNLAQACAEGIFFVTLFAIIFFFRKLGIMEAFIFANEQISKDETLHRDYYCAKASENGINNYAQEAIAMCDEAIAIEIEFLSFLLRTPIQEGNLDQELGLTVENLTELVKLLADQILVQCGFESHYNGLPNTPWMNDLGLSKKTNFYEKTVGNYKKGSAESQKDWKSSIGEKTNEDEEVYF
jgi:ribonucleoside-diphosphate reductase subunit M2